jgi:hypothetical protein
MVTKGLILIIYIFFPFVTCSVLVNVAAKEGSRARLISTVALLEQSYGLFEVCDYSS